MGYCTWFSKVWRFPPNPLPQGLKPLLTLNPLSQLLAGTVQVGAVRAPGGGGGRGEPSVHRPMCQKTAAAAGRFFPHVSTHGSGLGAAVGQLLAVLQNIHTIQCAAA
jgi:hypothetical protein